MLLNENPITLSQLQKYFEMYVERQLGSDQCTQGLQDKLAIGNLTYRLEKFMFVRGFQEWIKKISLY